MAEEAEVLFGLGMGATLLLCKCSWRWLGSRCRHAWALTSQAKQPAYSMNACDLGQRTRAERRCGNPRVGVHGWDKSTWEPAHAQDCVHMQAHKPVGSQRRCHTAVLPYSVGGLATVQR